MISATRLTSSPAITRSAMASAWSVGQGGDQGECRPGRGASHGGRRPGHQLPGVRPARSPAGPGSALVLSTATQVSYARSSAAPAAITLK